jgi:hypothetical protein
MDSSIRIADVAEQLAGIEHYLRDPASAPLDRAAAIDALLLAQAVLRELDALAQRHGELAEPSAATPAAA